MADTIIKVENLSKKFTIGAREPYYSLRDQIASLWSFKNKKLSEEFWALKDLNFEIKRGEAVGIIGRNGAGKSTLLKILSQITPPTTGKITMKGRVASLLEVGTGFNQELTGRENIFLNGAILGLSRDEIKRKFDEIVAFAEIDKFLDTPVKRYSSGMYVRLAFAIAAHLDPDILIVDEVLAVGDALFQKKCLGKMDQVAKKEGRTVLFVSHNMGAIKNLCKEVIYLSSGRIKSVGSVNKIIENYEKDYLINSSSDLFETDDEEIIELQKFNLTVDDSNDFIWEAKLKMNRKPKSFNMVLGINNSEGVRVMAITSLDSISPQKLPVGREFVVKGKLENKIILPSGIYSCDFGVRFNDRTILYLQGLVNVHVREQKVYENQNGLVRVNSNWIII